MGQNVQQKQQQHPPWPDYLQEQRLREQLNEGCRLARELDERLRSIPEGRLMEMACATAPLQQGDGAAAAPAVHDMSRRSSSLAMAAAEVVGAFNEAVKLLLQSSAYNLISRQGNVNLPVIAADLSAATASPANNKQLAAIVGSNCCLAMKSPPLSPPNFSAPARNRNIAVKQGVMSCSPPGLMIHSPLQLSATTTSDMSEGSPSPHILDQRPHSSADEAATTSATPAVKAVLCRKRKLLPKVTMRMAAASVESAESNTAPDDGHTWRKYGQKVIHGALHPRGYYRCTHKAGIGCPAIKQVQRCDEEQMMFEVVYKGYHTCRSAEVDKKYWPLAFPQGLCSLVNVASSDSTSAQAAAVLSSLLNFSTTTTTTTCQLPNASSAALSLGASAEVAINQLAATSDHFNRAPDTAHPLYGDGSYAQAQSPAFSPLEDWSKFNNRPCKIRPFMKASHGRHQQLLPPLRNQGHHHHDMLITTEKQHLIVEKERQQMIPQLYESLIGSKPTNPPTLQMNAITSHEQIDASIMSTSMPMNISIDPRSPVHLDHHFGTTGSTLPSYDDTDNDNPLSNIFIDPFY